ncbi:hypothetical protein ACFLV6_00160 [Chloroflexota bacterium]
MLIQHYSEEFVSFFPRYPSAEIKWWEIMPLFNKDELRWGASYIVEETAEHKRAGEES